ncbi:MAG: hypothetical protein IT529_00220 [Burkholderiales bacterium]|nr:hypothetical protein [Burkholderiales bacterium]
MSESEPVQGAQLRPPCPGRTRGGTTAIVAEPAAPVQVGVWIESPGGDPASSSSSALRSAGRATANWVSAWQPAGYPLGILGLLATPAALVSGALQGWHETGEHAARHHAAAAAIQAGMRDLGPELARIVADRVDAGRNEKVVRLDQDAVLVRKRYRDLAACGIAAVMEIGIVRAGLSAPSVVEYTMRPTIVARVRAVRTADEVEVLSEDFRFDGRYHAFEAVLADDGRAAREDLARGLHEIAARIAAWRN